VLRFRKIDSRASIPSRKYKFDAGLDVYCLDGFVLPPGQQSVVRTGIALEGAPANCVIQIWPKSGIAAKLCVHTGAGIIDSGYRGEILVVVMNTGSAYLKFDAGDAIAQLVVLPCMFLEVEEVAKSFSYISDRGADGGIARVLKEIK